MYVTATGTTTTTQYGSGQNTQSLASLDNFLKLLISQIQYQDPLSPVQDHEFIAQLAQFSQLEAVQTANSQLDSIGALLESSLYYQGLQLLGREVDIQTEAGIVTGFVDGVSFKNGRPTLSVDGKSIELSQVLQVRIAAAAEGGEEGEQ